MYFLLLSVVAVLFLFAVNRGQLRLSMVVAMGVGFALYYVTLGRLFFALYATVLRICFRVLGFVYCHTLRHLWVLLAYLYQISLGKAVVYLKNCWIRVLLRILVKRSRIKLERLLNLAQNGFENMDDQISVN